MLSSFQPDPVGKPESSGQQPDELPDPPESRGPGGILDQILHVAGSEHQHSAVDERYRRELLQVAARLHDYDFCLDPVLLSMVRVITGRLKNLSESQYLAVQRSVANSLYDDIASRERLERLWQHLVRLASDAE